MKHRIVAGTAILAVGLLAQLALVPSASAETGPPLGATCQSDASCELALGQFIKLYGDVGLNSDPIPSADFTPPLCLWDDYGNQETGSQAIIDVAYTLLHVYQPPESYEMEQEIAPDVKLAHKLLAAGKPTGNWYVILPNGTDTTAQAATCDQYPLFQFVPTGTVPLVLPPVPPVFLAQYAFNHMQLPKPKLVISPADKGWVNLATFVQTTWRRELANTPAQYIEATLGDQAATVWAQPTGVSISVSGDGQTYDSCSVSGLASAKTPATGPGVPPSCGVLWTETDTGATISATITWRVTWYAGLEHGPGGAAVPGTDGGLVTTTGVHPAIRVYAIESINNG
jgi:hypothetical protein